VTDRGEAPLARSWPDLVFCIAFPDSGVETATRVWCRVSVVSGPATTTDAIRIATSGRVSTATDAGGRCHVFEIDATALSAKCQQPSHQSVKNTVIRVSEERPKGRCSLRCHALRNIADQSEEILLETSRSTLLGHFRVDAKDLPILRQ
jgi:hypothetical protein